MTESFQKYRVTSTDRSWQDGRGTSHATLLQYERTATRAFTLHTIIISWRARARS